MAVPPPLAPRIVLEQPSPPLVAGELFHVLFDHPPGDLPNVTSFQLLIDAAVVQTIPTAQQSQGFTVPTGRPAGSHTFVVAAVGPGGTTPSAPPVTLTINPAPPQPPPPPSAWPQGAVVQIARGVLTPPATWTSQLLGAALPAGSWVLSAARHTVAVGGIDIWGTADQGRVVLQPVTGDFDVTARVESFASANAWSKAGVMVRETLSAGSKNVYLAATGASGWQFQWRTATGGVSASVLGRPAGAAPGWVRLTRRGTVFTAYRSVDGLIWTLFPVTSTASIAMTPSVYVGVAVTSHQAGTMATAVFTNVTVQ